MKRAVAILILFSMGLHCASRLGFISYLYSQRHSIAYSVGLIAEIPIGICSSDYVNKNAPLLIADHNESEKQVPASLSHAREITLFVERSLDFDASASVETLTHQTPALLIFYSSPDLPVFHPPCEA